jgi:hypothetical protein
MVLEGAVQFTTGVSGERWYLLSFSSGLCCQGKDEHAPEGEEYKVTKVTVCRSETATGPWL